MTHFQFASKQLIFGLVTIVIILLAIIAAGAIYISRQTPSGTKQSEPETQSNTDANRDDDEEAHVLSTGPDLTKLPLGDQKYSTSAKVGYIYLCNTNLNGGGASAAGPWINQATNTWDLTAKLSVSGSVNWANANISFVLDGSTRRVTGNGLPEHTTGVYPISSNDDAYAYDRNPNSIQTQTLLLNLPANPQVTAMPSCMGGEVGIMLSGTPLFNGFDAGGRDAAAWEVQDECQGHPQASGQYHYHSASDCIEDNSGDNQHSELLGYALDGFGIYGKKGESGAVLSSSDLDECHGHTHEITWDGELKEMYHYHLTSDFPYSVGCFKGEPVSLQLISGGNQQGGMMPPPPRPR